MRFSYPRSLLWLAYDLRKLHTYTRPGEGQIISKRPRQADLKRAISSAYYALFHAIIEGCTEVLLGQSRELSALPRVLVPRAFEHGNIYACCEEIKKTLQYNKDGDITNRRKKWQGIITEPPSPELLSLAKAFIKLYQNRHEADYNTGARYSKKEVLNSLQQAHQAIDSLEQALNIRDANLGLFALACLLGTQTRAL